MAQRATTATLAPPMTPARTARVEAQQQTARQKATSAMMAFVALTGPAANARSKTAQAVTLTMTAAPPAIAARVGYARRVPGSTAARLITTATRALAGLQTANASGKRSQTARCAALMAPARRESARKPCVENLGIPATRPTIAVARTIPLHARPWLPIATRAVSPKMRAVAARHAKRAATTASAVALLAARVVNAATNQAAPAVATTTAATAGLRQHASVVCVASRKAHSAKRMANAARGLARTTSARVAFPCARNAKARMSAANRPERRSAANPLTSIPQTAASPGAAPAAATTIAVTAAPATMVAVARARISSAIQTPTAARVLNAAAACAVPTSAWRRGNHVLKGLQVVAQVAARAPVACVAIRLGRPASRHQGPALHAVESTPSVVVQMAPRVAFTTSLTFWVGTTNAPATTSAVVVTATPMATAVVLKVRRAPRSAHWASNVARILA